MDGSKHLSPTETGSSVVPKSAKEDFARLSGYLSYFSPAYTRTPFEASTMQITKDKQNFVVGETNGCAALCSRFGKEVLQEKKVAGCTIEALCMSDSGEEFYIGGGNGEIIVVGLKDFEVVERFFAGKARITQIKLLDAENILVANEHNVVMKWNVKSKHSSVAHSHENNVTSLDVSEEYIVSGSTTGAVIVTNKNFDLVFTVKQECRVSCIKVSKDYLVVSFFNDIHVFTVGTWEKKFELRSHQDGIISMDICNNVLVTGSTDSSLKVWRLDQWSDETTLYGHTSAVTSIIIEDNIIHSLGKGLKIRASHIPPVQAIANYKAEIEIQDIIHNCKNNITYGINSEHEIFEIVSKRKLKTCNNLHIGWSFTNFNTILAVFYRKSEDSTATEVCLINLDDKASCQCFELRTSSVPTICIATDGTKFLITGEMFRITIWKSADGTQEYIFRSHNADITAMATVGEHLFAGDAAGCIKQYNLETFTETATFNEIDQVSVRTLKISKDFKLLFSANGPDAISIWSIQKKSSVYRLTTQSPVKQIHFSEDREHFFLNFGKSLEIWSAKSFANYFTMTFRDENSNLVPGSLENSLICTFPGYTKVFESPLKAEQIKVYGNTEKSHKFIEYVTEIVSGRIPKYDVEMNNFQIQPFHINILHIYSYFNLSNHLGKAVASNAAFYPSATGYTPLSICMERFYSDCIDSLLHNMLPRLQQNPMHFYYIGGSMSKLNIYSPDCLNQLYELGFRKSLDNTMPGFCFENVSLPVLKESAKVFLPAENFMPLAQFQSQEKAIEFTQSYFKVSSITGSQTSIDFIQSLVECKNLEIFTTMFVKTYIGDKWGKLKWVHFLDAFLYFVYLVALCFGSYSHKMHWVLIIPFCINQILMIYEIFQMVSARSIYFKSFLNYLDMFRTVLFNLYCAVEFFDLHETTQEPILLVTILLSLVRGFGYFRVFSTTRWVVYLIVEVFYQLWAFIIVTIYTIVSLGIIYKSSINSEDLIEANAFKLEWLLLFFIIIINPLIILNLFISIVGNALEKVKDERVVKEQQELAEMIFEAEILIFWRRSQQKQKFLHLCVEEQANSTALNSVSEKIRTTAEKADDLVRQFEKNSSEIAILKQVLTDQLEALNIRTDALREAAAIS